MLLAPRYHSICIKVVEFPCFFFFFFVYFWLEFVLLKSLENTLLFIKSYSSYNFSSNDLFFYFVLSTYLYSFAVILRYFRKQCSNLFCLKILLIQLIEPQFVLILAHFLVSTKKDLNSTFFNFHNKIRLNFFFIHFLHFFATFVKLVYVYSSKWLPLDIGNSTTIESFLYTACLHNRITKHFFFIFILKKKQFFISMLLILTFDMAMLIFEHCIDFSVLENNILLCNLKECQVTIQIQKWVFL